MTPDLIHRVRESLATSPRRTGSVDPAAFRWLFDAVFRDGLVPDRLPAIGSVLLDEEGRIWVSRFLPPSDLGSLLAGEEPWSQEHAWHVLGQDGSPLARVRLPPMGRLVAATGDRVLMIMRDSLDVESVVVLPLRRR